MKKVARWRQAKLVEFSHSLCSERRSPDLQPADWGHLVKGCWSWFWTALELSAVSWRLRNDRPLYRYWFISIFLFFSRTEIPEDLQKLPPGFPRGAVPQPPFPPLSPTMAQMHTLMPAQSLQPTQQLEYKVRINEAAAIPWGSSGQRWYCTMVSSGGPTLTTECQARSPCRSFLQSLVWPIWNPQPTSLGATMFYTFLHIPMSN